MVKRQFEFSAETDLTLPDPKTTDKTVVFAVAATLLEGRLTPENPYGWRPTLDLCGQPTFPIDELHLLVHSPSMYLVPQLQKDISNISPNTKIIIHKLSVEPITDTLQQYNFFSNFFYKFKFSKYGTKYYINLSPGGFLLYYCLLFVINEQNLPIKFVFLLPDKRMLIGAPSDIRLGAKGGFLQEYQNTEKDTSAPRIEVRNKHFSGLIANIERVAASSSAPILITGETGTGKSQLARSLYQIKKQHSQVTGPFVEVSCATLRGDSALSALFGHVRGAYTGAEQNRQGLLRQAHKGVLFLDEIGEMDLESQALLVKAIEEKSFMPVGADVPVYSDFQLICGTNRDLHEGTLNGTFREDLFARINLWSFHLPALRERPEDIEPNLEFEMTRMSAELGHLLLFQPAAREAFLRFAMSPEALWLGNFRDFSAAITRMGTLITNGVITLAAVEAEVDYLLRLWARQHESSIHKNAPRPMPASRPAEPPAPAISSMPSTASAWSDGRLERLAEAGLMPPEAVPRDYFSRVQLEGVVRICLESASLREAGQKIFGSDQSPDRQANRLSKYLKSRGLSWRHIKSGKLA